MPTTQPVPPDAGRGASAPDTATSPTVAQLLQESRAHHLNKNKFSNRKVGGHFAPDYQAAEAEIALALEKRLQAHALDPHHRDPAWSLDPVPHEDLVAFYRLYPTIP